MPARPPLRRAIVRLTDFALAGLFLVAVAPFLVLPADWTVRCFGALGRTLLPFWPSARRIADNLALTGAGHDFRALTRAVGDHFGRTIAEFVRLPAILARPDRRQVAGLSHLRTALAEGHGVVVVSAHFGNWEMLRAAARDAGIELALIYRAFNNRSFDALVAWRLEAAGRPVLHKGRPGMRALLAHLRAGGAILVLLDQHSSGGAWLPFLGRPAATATAIATLCQRSGAVLLPAVAKRRADGLSFAIRFEPPVPSGSPIAMTAAINDRIAAWVEADPGQWFWLHRRWRPRPDGVSRKP